jgi:hypothetical protein
METLLYAGCVIVLTDLSSENLAAGMGEDGTCISTLSAACRNKILSRVTANALAVTGNATAPNCQLLFAGKDGSETGVEWDSCRGLWSGSPHVKSCKPLDFSESKTEREKIMLRSENSDGTKD